MVRGPTEQGLSLTEKVDGLIMEISKLWTSEPDQTARADFVQAANLLLDARYHLLEATGQLEMGAN